jgi:hypothetical protein
MARVLLLANGPMGLRFARESGDEIVGLAIMPAERRRNADEIADASCSMSSGR